VVIVLSVFLLVTLSLGFGLEIMMDTKSSTDDVAGVVTSIGKIFSAMNQKEVSEQPTKK